MAERFMKIASHVIISKSAHAPILPSSWFTLYELTPSSGRSLRQVRSLRKRRCAAAADVPDGKPFMSLELLSRLSALVGRRAGRRSTLQAPHPTEKE
jgi:hypothetical protein